MSCFFPVVELGFSRRTSEIGGYGYSVRDGYSSRDEVSSSRHGSVNLQGDDTSSHNIT